MLLFSSQLYAMDPCFTGTWHDPEVDLEGLNVEVLDDKVIAFWYTYSFFERQEQNWILFQGEPSDMVAYDVFGEHLYSIGKGSITVIDNNTIEFHYDIDINLDDTSLVTPWCLNELCSGTLTYTRLTQPLQC